MSDNKLLLPGLGGPALLGAKRSTAEKSKLEERAEQWQRNQLQGWAIVAIMPNGETVVDFDISDVNSLHEISCLGAGARSLIDAMMTLYVQNGGVIPTKQ